MAENIAPGRRAVTARHPLVRALAVVIGLEAVALVVAAGVLVTQLLTTPAFSVPSAIALVGFCLLAAVWLLVMWRAVRTGRAWTRGASIVVQVLFGAVALTAAQSGMPVLAVLVAVPALAALVLVFSPPVVAALSGRGE
ncbi:MAG: hypothetical protein QM635_02340 [Microbacteriaceae bacterium]